MRAAARTLVEKAKAFASKGARFKRALWHATGRNVQLVISMGSETYGAFMYGLAVEERMQMVMNETPDINLYGATFREDRDMPEKELRMSLIVEKERV